MTVLTLNLKQFIATSDEFFDLCQANPDLHLERTTDGEVIIMPLQAVKQAHAIQALQANFGGGTNVFNRG